MPIKTLAMCADDFGENEAKCSAILDLARHGRLSDVSCLTDPPLWKRLGAQLRDANERLRIGLHFNLTLPFGHSERTLVSWMLAAVLSRVDVAHVRVHLERQLGTFEKVVGRWPDFIDGHEHVHAFPQIRTVVRDVVLELPGTRIRSLGNMFGRTDAPLKRAVIRKIAALGAKNTRRDADAPTLNTAFAGDYSMRASAGFPDLCESWIAAAPDGALIMCHPAIEGPGAHEYRYLSSASYLDALRASHASLYGEARRIFTAPSV